MSFNFRVYAGPPPQQGNNAQRLNQLAHAMGRGQAQPPQEQQGNARILNQIAHAVNQRPQNDNRNDNQNQD